MRNPTITSADLATVPETDLIIALYERGIQIEHIMGSYYAMTENRYHRSDEAVGYNEAGLHGAKSDEPTESDTD